MATERTQYSSIRCVFLREEFLRAVSVFAKLFLRFKYLNILPGSFDKVDEIDVLPEDGLVQTTALSNENQTVYTTRDAPHGIGQVVLERGLFSGHDRACTSY
jgi:hypothetical protein